MADPKGWCKLAGEPQTEAELEAIRRGVARGQPSGGEQWVRRTAEQLGLESTLRAPTGRERGSRTNGSPNKRAFPPQLRTAERFPINDAEIR